MENDTLDLDGLAQYLQRDKREVAKMVQRGLVPGRKVGGEWRFSRPEINHWIETQLSGFTEQELTALESRGVRSPEQESVVGNLLNERCIEVPLAASTKSSVLKELVRLAEQSWHVYDSDAILDAIRQREEIASTALESGVAVPHPRRPLPAALGESVIAYGRTGSGIPFGAPDGGLTDIFFLVCCRDEKTHLRALARLSRLFLRPGFLYALRAADTAAATWQVIAQAERELLLG
jgi:PTS system nitrogen regulatory IIA component